MFFIIFTIIIGLSFILGIIIMHYIIPIQQHAFIHYAEIEYTNILIMDFTQQYHNYNSDDDRYII